MEKITIVQESYLRNGGDMEGYNYYYFKYINSAQKFIEKMTEKYKDVYSMDRHKFQILEIETLFEDAEEAEKYYLEESSED